MPVNGYIDGKATATATASGETLNIVMNGGAESGSAASDDHGVVAPANWTVTGNFTAVKYGSSGFPDAAASTSVHGGANLFAGGPDNSESSATQKDEIPADWVSAVSGGHVTATLSASLGGYENQPDATTVRYQFLDGSGTTLLDATIGPVAPSQRQNITGLKAVSKVVTVPAGTRSVQITISAIRGIGAYNDGSADNVALTLGR